MSERDRVRAGRRRVAGAATSVGAFLAFGLSPLAASPAQADFDFFDPSSWFDAADTPGAADFTFSDWGGLFMGEPGAWMDFDSQLYTAIYDPDGGDDLQLGQ